MLSFKKRKKFQGEKIPPITDYQALRKLTYSSHSTPQGNFHQTSALQILHMTSYNKRIPSKGRGYSPVIEQLFSMCEEAPSVPPLASAPQISIYSYMFII